MKYLVVLGCSHAVGTGLDIVIGHDSEGRKKSHKDCLLICIDGTKSIIGLISDEIIISSVYHQKC